jgi:1,4-dihydroxy-2-naphthoate octaprenyltransferase
MRAAPWVMAARPRTLGLPVTPVAVGIALAWAMEEGFAGSQLWQL